MDEDEVKRATHKLKTDFNEKIEAVTMSSYLSDETLRRKKEAERKEDVLKKYFCEL